MNGFPNVQSLLSPGSPLPVDETVESMREIQVPEPGWAVQAVHKQQPAKESGMWSEANEKGTRLQGWKDSMDSLYDFAKFSTVCSECEQVRPVGIRRHRICFLNFKSRLSAHGTRIPSRVNPILLFEWGGWSSSGDAGWGSGRPRNRAVQSSSLLGCNATVGQKPCPMYCANCVASCGIRLITGCRN